MDVREKLVELLKTSPIRDGCIAIEDIADHLISNGITVDVREKMTRLDYEAEYNRLKQKMSKQNEENKHLREELKEKERELRYYQGFEAACMLILGEHGCHNGWRLEQ